MTKKEMTKREKIEYIMTLPCILEDNIAREYLEHELELLATRKEGTGEKAKKKAEENANIRKEILRVLTAGNDNGMTATEIQRAYNGEITPQKIVGIMRGMIDEGTVERFVCKKTPYFKLSEREVEGGKES